MFLIRELTENIDFLVEKTKTGKKKLYVEGIIMQAEQKNRNGRIYPMGVLEPKVNKYIDEKVKTGGAFGELGHPDGPTVNPSLTCHRFTSIIKEGNNFIGKAEVLTGDNGPGDKLANIISHGGRPGMSSRGLGSLKQVGEVMEVQEDFHLATAGDIVIDPSAPDAFVQGVMEGQEWIITPDGRYERFVSDSQKVIDKSVREGNLTEAKDEIWGRFIKTL
tara:strand:- start:18916 stop:19572 length:657 start_codon:yes stop_codon:yes gene_type:complete